MVEALAEFQTDDGPELVLADDVARNKSFSPKVINEQTAGLSRRELEVLEQASRGLSRSESGRETYHSERTIRFHRERIARKLGVKTTARAINLAISTGILRSEIGYQTDDLLTPAERVVLVTLANSDSNAETAMKLERRESTIKFHKSNIFSKFGAKNLAHAITLGYEHGYFAHGPEEQKY